MIEPGSEAPMSFVRSDLRSIQQRARRQRERLQQANQVVRQVQAVLTRFGSSPVRTVKSLPSRYIAHGIVALTVPIAIGISQLPDRPVAEPSSRTLSVADRPIELGPLDMGQPAELTIQVGDPPLDMDAIPMPVSLVSRREALAPLVVPATISVEQAKLRNGPGLDYDAVGLMETGAPLQVIGRYGDWFQVREGEGLPVYWVAGELVQIPEAAYYALFEVAAEDIPPPPPPKVGLVRENGLNLRDGPGTNYVSMTKIDVGAEVALVEMYKDWFHVDFDGNSEGWVHADFLDVGPGIVHRVPITNEIPDPNPALVAAINQNSVNLREGPGTVYHSLGRIGADTQVDLLARHKDWFKVQLSDGRKAWVFSDLLNMSPMVRRRIPYTNNIPSPPPRYVPRATSNTGVARSNGGGSPSRGNTGSPAVAAPAPPVAIPASGDVASYALRFVGSRYVYGGASPATGFDCSGFTVYVYRQYGVHLPHSAAAQYSTAYGAAVGSMNNLAPGDLVFFAGTYGRGISHVAIYIGGGSIVHAMTPSLGVQVSSLWSNYWTSHYYGAIRVRR